MEFPLDFPMHVSAGVVIPANDGSVWPSTGTGKTPGRILSTFDVVEFSACTLTRCRDVASLPQDAHWVNASGENFPKSIGSHK